MNEILLYAAGFLVGYAVRGIRGRCGYCWRGGKL